MKCLYRSIAFAFTLAIFTSAHAQEAAPPTDRDTIRANADAFQQAFDGGDAKAVAALWTEDGEYIGENGERFRGREAIEKQYAEFFKANPGAKLTLQIDSIRLLGPDTAQEEGTASMVESANGPPTKSRYSVIHVKKDGGWLMATVRDEHLDTPSHFGRLADLNWLIGTWSTEKEGVTLDITYQWIAQKNFIEQTFVGHQGNHIVSSGKQIIGWDPASGRIMSWTFTSDGGHAVGGWSPHASGWSIETSGVRADGVPTTAVNILSRLDDNAMTWHSVQRRAGPFRILDSQEVILKRKPPENATGQNQ